MEAQARIIPRVIDDEMKVSYLGYSMSVIVGRALPDARDGLKPVHRRVLYGMYEMGMLHNKPFKKSARIVGDVMGKFHPHGDAAIYDTLVRLAQDFSLRYPLVQGQGNFGCFTKDTKVRLADGRELSFGELVDEDKAGKTNFTFTVDDEGRIEIARITSPRITKKNADLVKVTLDTGAEIKCTPSHRFMLKNGTYTEANDLEPGMSLMPGYFRLGQKEENAHTAGYEMVFQPKEEVWDYSHILADGWNLRNRTYPKIAGRVRHHIDFDKRNNNPTNILRMHWGKHLKLHSEHAAELHVSPAYREKIAAGRVRFWSSPEVRKQYAQRMSRQNKERWQDPLYREHKRKQLSDVNKAYLQTHPEVRKLFGIRARETMTRLWKDPAYRLLFHEKIVKANKNRKTNNTGKAKFLRICHETLAEYQTVTQESYETTRQLQFGKEFTTWEKGLRKYFDNDTGAVYAEMCANHKVAKVEVLHETADVYDLTIQDTHNFLLGAGVFVHNSIDGDNAAAMRYTESRLKKLAEELLQDIDKETVPFVPNYDGSLKEPSVLPAKFPNLLVNGSAGIAVGMATNIPPHNMGEVCDATVYAIDHPDATSADLMKYVQAPDFPTGGSIIGSSGIREAYATGRGKILVRGKIQVEEIKQKTKLIITEVPYQVNKAQLVEEIADLVRDKKVQGVSDLRDESDRDGLRVVIELKSGANADVVMNQLFSHSRLQTTFGIIMLALVNNEPKILSLRELVQAFIDHRKEMVTKRTAFDLKEAEQKAHILEGLIVALDHIDTAIALIKKSKSAESARQQLRAEFRLTEIQANAILDMKLQKLTNLEQQKIREEHQGLLEKIAELKSILASAQKILDIIKKELEEVKAAYGDKRRTIVLDQEATVEEESLIKPEDVVVTVTQTGYVKRLPLETYKQQHRSGKGIIAVTTKEEDVVERVFIANTHHYLLFFTNKGKVHWLKVHQLPEASRQARGTAVVNLLQLDEGEQVSAIVPVKEFGANYLFMVTKNGIVKKTALEEFSRPRKGGIIALTLPEDDQLIDVFQTDGKREIIIATAEGMAIRFAEEDVRAMGRTAYGVIGIKLKEKDAVVGAVVADETKTLLVVTENGYGKRSPVADYRLINRGGVGVININLTDKTGQVISIKEVSDDDELILISKKGVIIRIPTNQVSVIGRNTQGVRLMRLDDGDKVASVASITHAGNSTDQPGN